MASGPLFELVEHTEVLGQQTVLRDLNLTINRGERVAILGPSGAGKSTLLNVLHRQQPTIAAFQPQGGGLVDNLSVYQNIFMGALDRVNTFLALWNLIRPLSRHKHQIKNLTSLLGLQDKLWHSVDRLSGGQRQRVAIGRGLYRQQALYLGDEPVSSLDPVQAQSLLSHILEQHETAVVSLHQRDLALTHFDRIVILLEGRVGFDGPASSLTQTQLNAFYKQEASPHDPNPIGPRPEGWIVGSG